MNDYKALNVINYYYDACSLKEIERSGWKLWNVARNKRIESIPEHIYGAQHLAMAIYSEYNLNIDIFKVITMLSLHETEEIKLGDITPFDTSPAQISAQEAVEETMSRLTKKNMFIELITEFNEQKTPEAKFAYLCDKLECDLQAKKYSDEGRMSFEGVAPQIINNKTVQKIINSVSPIKEL